MSTTHREGRWKGRRPRAKHGLRAGLPRGTGWGLGRSAVAPLQCGGLGAFPQKILKFNSAKLFIFYTISRHFATSHNTLQQSQMHTWQSQLHSLCQKTHNFRPCETATENDESSTSTAYFLCSLFILDYQCGFGFGFDFGFILRLRN